MLQTIESLATVPFTAEEVEKAKVRSRRNAENMQSNSTAMSQALSSASALGDWRLLFIQRDREAAVTAKDVNRVARTYFQKHNRTVGLYIPTEQAERLAIAAAPPLDTLVKDYKGGTVAEAGEVFVPTPENLDARTKFVEIGGIKAGLLEKKNRGNTVALLLTLHYGNEQSLKDQTTAAAMLPALMMAGTKKHDLDSAARGVRQARHPHFRGGRRGRRRRSPGRRWWRRRHGGGADVLRRGQARHAAGGHQAAGRNPARAGVPGRGVRLHEASPAAGSASGREPTRRPLAANRLVRALLARTRRGTSATSRPPRKARNGCKTLQLTR